VEYTSSLFFLGGFGYCAVELLYSGHTHWSMFLAGGLCLPLLYGMNLSLAHLPFLARCALGAVCITAVELIFGLFFNRLLGWAVWDYSGLWGNLWGQICPLYSFFWFLLCIPVLWAFDRLAAGLGPFFRPL